MTTLLAVSNFSTSTQAIVVKPRISSVVRMTDSTFSIVSPITTISTQGSYIVITGNGFTSNSQAFIRSVGSKGASVVPLISFINSTQINCLLPNSNAGSKMLYLVNNVGYTVITIVTYQ
jgi:hypothetical protein